MGMFEVPVKLASLVALMRTEELSLLVYTGATLSRIPRETLERLGATMFSRLPFELDDGRRLERDVSTVLLMIDGRKAPVPVTFGEPGEAAVLGATALESRGLLVDPVAQKLVPRNLRLLRAEPSRESRSVPAKAQEQTGRSGRIVNRGTPLGS